MKKALALDGLASPLSNKSLSLTISKLPDLPVLDPRTL